MAAGPKPRGRPEVAHHRGAPLAPPRHPWAPDPTDISGVREWLASRSRPTAVDLFAGAGGLSLGLEQAGFDVIVGADSDMWAMETHAANVAGLSWSGDLADPTDFLQTLDVWGIEHVDLVAGGVPCQPFSRAGSSRMRAMVDSGERGAHDARADLWQSFIQVVERLRPRAVLVENVPDLPRWNDGAVLTGFFDSLGELGYAVDARVLEGFRFGVPQHRQRLFLIGLLGGEVPAWPAPIDELVTLRDAIGDLPVIPRAQRAQELPYLAPADETDGDFREEMRANMVGDTARVVWDHVCRDVRGDDLEAYTLMSEGQTYVDLPQRFRRYRSDVFTDKYKRLAWGELCRSITAHIAKDGYWYIHPDQHRTLSIREAARVQTFPDDFRFAGTPTHRYRQIGNAVPPRLGRAVGKAIQQALSRPRHARIGVDSVRRALVEWHDAERTGFKWRLGAKPWHVLMAELSLSRLPPAKAARTYPKIVGIAPHPRAFVEGGDPARDALVSAGLTESKARLLMNVATSLVDSHGGEVPEDEMKMRALPSVGDNVCQAVRCFGFNSRAALLDRPTARIVSRLAGREEPRRFQVRLDLYRLAGSRGPDAPFNHALLDLGATTCLPREPRCDACPLSDQCATGRIHTDRDHQAADPALTVPEVSA